MTAPAPGARPTPLRLGLVGAGPWGRNIIKTLERLDGLTLSHLVTRRAGNRALLDDGCAIVDDVRAILSPDLLDGLVVAVPPPAQPDIVLAALAAGLPVFAEKPLAMDVATAERIAEAAGRTGVPLMVDHVHLFSPAFRGLVAGLGDIGLHFPPEDPAYAGADSRELGRRVGVLLRREGFEVVNLDLMVLAETPKIREHAASMRGSIGEALGVDPARVSLKATTLEGLGALGRREGIACQAVALIRGRGEGR